MNKKLLFIVLIGIFLSGCSSPLIYPNKYKKNMTVTLKTNETSGFFTKFQVLAGVNDLNKKCEIDYKGHVELEKGKNKIGLVPGQLTLFLINIAHTRGYSLSNFKNGMLLRPKKGRRYELEIDYIDSLLDMRLYEVRKSMRKRLKIVPQSGCRPGM